MTEVEVFPTRREFDKKFPSRIFLCSVCGKFTTNPYICTSCGTQANRMFDEKIYQYKILSESDEVIRIFEPIELKKEEK